MNILEKKEDDVIEGSFAIATSPNSIMSMTNEDRTVALLAIIAKRLGMIEGHEKAARTFGEKIEALNIKFEPTPTLAVAADAARYRWLMRHFISYSAPDDGPLIEMNFVPHPKDEKCAADFKKQFDAYLDRLMEKL